ncbi:Dicer-like protein 1 [Bienertia sinuspersici]
MISMEERPALWQSQSNSMTSSMVGRVMSTLLSSKPKKLEDAIVRLSEASNSTSAVTLEDSLRILNKYVRDIVDEEQTLDEVLIPIIENVLRCKESKHPNQAMILLNWLFQDEILFLPLAQDLVSIISRREDRYIALGWCRLVRTLVKYEINMTNFSKVEVTQVKVEEGWERWDSGLRDNYQALIKILSSSIEHLSIMVKNGSVLQDGFELPTRLSAAAADCILVLTEALTQKLSDSVNLSEKGAYRSNSDKPISVIETKLVEQKNMSSAVSNKFDGSLLLWQNLDRLILLVQKLQLWSQKSRNLHAKGLGKILKWLQQLASSCTRVEAGYQFQTTLLSSCWRHYSVLSLLEDIESYQRYDVLIEQYLSGIEFYSEDNLKDQAENRDSCVETNKFFLNCLALLLGRLDLKRLECTASLHGQRISRALLSQSESLFFNLSSEQFSGGAFVRDISCGWGNGWFVEIDGGEVDVTCDNEAEVVHDAARIVAQGSDKAIEVVCKVAWVSEYAVSGLQDFNGFMWMIKELLKCRVIAFASRACIRWVYIVWLILGEKATFVALWLHCADEDVVDVAVCIFRLVIFKVAGTGSSPIDSKESLLPLLGLLDKRDGAAKAVTALIADYCSM